MFKTRTSCSKLEHDVHKFEHACSKDANMYVTDGNMHVTDVNMHVTDVNIDLILLECFATWSNVERAEGKSWSRSRLGRVGDEARELLPWTAGPGTQKNFDPEHPLARDSKGRNLALLLYSCLIQYVSCRPPSHYVSRTHCLSPAVPHACTLACMSVMVEVVKGAKFLHEVH
jgi:hypothetical protein